MPELSAEQQSSFDNRLRELGMDPSGVVERLSTADGPIVLSDDPEESSIPPRAITLDTVAHAKRLAGVPNDSYDSGEIEEHHEIPPPWEAEKNNHGLHDLSPDHNRQITQALPAYVYGHSDRVASYETVLNNRHFPMIASAFAVRDVVVDPAHPLRITATSAANFGTVTIKPGGQIIIEADVTITCQKMIVE